MGCGPRRATWSRRPGGAGLSDVAGLVPWTDRVWAWPLLTVPAPFGRYHAQRECRYKTVTDWAHQRLRCVRRWLPARELVVIADRTYAALRFLAVCQQMAPPVTCLTRLRLDAVLHDPSPPGRRTPTLPTGPSGGPGHTLDCADPDLARRDEEASGLCFGHGSPDPSRPAHRPAALAASAGPGRRAPQALLSTDPDLDPRTILTWYLRRW